MSDDPVESLFHRAADLAPTERAAFLDAACPDTALRAEVEALLACDATPAILDSPLVRRADGEVPGRIGRYRLLRRIGEGGMGIVYEAEQDEPRRLVALKVMRPGLVSPGLLERFRREAHILGRLQHPAIARIYEAGLADDGRPFFAMELIRGAPLDEHAARLPAAERLALMALVCEAVQHAHEQGVVHRDLKPGNVLVEGGKPKVLDFGIARVSEADGDINLGRTQTGQLIGTPRYMSPEQVGGDALDARSDVYALGVILFELLAGRPPYRLDGLSLPDVLRVIREGDLARLGAADPAYRGDVETIVGKAMEKDKARRYASAGELAADIRRHLGHEPIRARPPSSVYRMAKFVRRYRGLVAGVSAVVAALVAGLIGTTLFAVKASRNADLARESEKESRYRAYRARIAAASGALSRHDVVDAAVQLEDAPEELRGWEWHHLRARLDESSFTIRLGEKESVALARGADGLRVVGYTDDRLRLLDLDGREVRSLSLAALGRVRPGERTFAGLLPGGRAGLLRKAGDAFRLLDEAGRVLVPLPGVREADSAGYARLGPDGSRLLVLRNVSSSAADIRLIDVTGRRPPVAVAGGFAWGVAFSPDGTRFVTADEDGVVRVRDSATGKVTAEGRGHRLKVLSAAFRGDGKRVVTASADETVRQWDAATGREAVPPFERHTGEVYAAAYSPDGKRVASGGSDRTVRVWGAEDRREVAVLHGHRGFVSEVAFVPDGRLLSIGDHPGAPTSTSDTGDSAVRLWEIEAGLPVLRGHTSYVYPVAVSPDGKSIASAGWDRTVRLWDAVTGEPTRTLTFAGVPRALAFSPDASRLYVGGEGAESLQTWDTATGESLPGPRWRGAVVRAVAAGGDGVAAAALGESRVYDAATNLRVATFPAGGRYTEKQALAYDADGRRLAGPGEDHTDIEVRDAATHERIALLKGHAGAVNAVAFHPDGRRLVSSGDDRTVRLWDATTGECEAVWRGHTDQVFAVAFHPEGKRLATAGRDRAVWLWDVDRGQEVARLQGHTNYVFSLAFTPDGSTLVSGSGDGTVRLWDTRPLRERYEARGRAAGR